MWNLIKLQIPKTWLWKNVAAYTRPLCLQFSTSDRNKKGDAPEEESNQKIKPDDTTASASENETRAQRIQRYKEKLEEFQKHQDYLQAVDDYIKFNGTKDEFFDPSYLVHFLKEYYKVAELKMDPFIEEILGLDSEELELFKQNNPAFAKEADELVEAKFTFERSAYVFNKKIDPKYQEHLKVAAKDPKEERKKEIRESIAKYDEFKKKNMNTVQPRIQITGNYNYEMHKKYTHDLKNSLAKEQINKYRDQLKLEPYIDSEKIVQKINKKGQRQNKEGNDQNFIALADANVMNQYQPHDEKVLEQMKSEMDQYSQNNPVKKHRRRNKRIDESIETYVAWRCFDRPFLRISEREPCISTILIPPKLLIKTFGNPTSPRYSIHTTGEYDFEDNNLDLFMIFDFKQTTNTHGPNFDNIEDYDEEIFKPLNRRKKWYPNPKEFWELETPQKFRIDCTDLANIKTFKKWIKKMCREATQKDISYEELLDNEFGKIDTFNDYDKEYPVNTEMTVHKYDFSYFLSEKEVAAESDKMEKIEIPESFELCKGKRIFTTVEEIKRKATEAEEEVYKAAS